MEGARTEAGADDGGGKETDEGDIAIFSVVETGHGEVLLPDGEELPIA